MSDVVKMRAEIAPLLSREYLVRVVKKFRTREEPGVSNADRGSAELAESAEYAECAECVCIGAEAYVECEGRTNKRERW